MRRSRFTPLLVHLDTLRSLNRAFRKQRIPRGIWLALVLLLLAVVFAFLAYAPILSPFIYPLL